MKQLLHETREYLRKSPIHGATENLDEHCAYGKGDEGRKEKKEFGVASNNLKDQIELGLED